MKTYNRTPQHIRPLKKFFSKCVATALAMLGVSLACSTSASADTATFDLGTPGTPPYTFIGGGGEVSWIAPGTLPAGTMLQAVSINVVLENASDVGTWASDLNVKFGGDLMIGSDGGNPDWSNGQNSSPGATCIDTKTAPADFTSVDLGATGVTLRNNWDGSTWSGTITITYELPQVATILSFDWSGYTGVIDQGAKTILLTVPIGTDFSTVAPNFTLSSGICDQTSGSAPAPAFAAPSPSVVHYVVTDGATVNDYTVTVQESAGVIILPSNTYTIDNGNTTRVGGTTTWNELGPLTIWNDGTLQTWPLQNDEVINNANMIWTGSGGTITFRFNDNDTHFKMNGTITSTATDPQTLSISTGHNGNGDRESVTFYSGIPNVGDASPLSVQVRFQSQTGSESYVNFPGANTFTGPITLIKGDNVQNAFLSIGGIRTKDGSTAGTGTLAGGNYPGTISLDTNTILNYLSSASQTLAGAISGVGKVNVDGGGTLTLAGSNTYSANTTVNAGSTLVLDNAGELKFVVTNASSNKVTGGGTATLNGDFVIDTTGVSVANGSWTLVDTATKSFGPTFGVAGFVAPGPIPTIWTKVDGTQTWEFDTSTGVLSLSSAATITSFSYNSSNGVINNNSLTIALIVPYGTSLAAIAPTFTTSSGTCNQTSGSAPSPSFAAANPVHYIVTDGASVNDYLVTVTVLPPGPPVGDYVRWFDASAMGLSNNDPVTQWNDNSVNAAHATVPAGNASPTFIANSGMESGKPAVYFPKNGGAGDSGALKFTTVSNIRSVFAVRKGSSFLLTDTVEYHFHSQSDDDPTAPLFDGNSSDRVRNGSTYVNGVLVDGTTFNMPTGLHNGFNLVEVLTTDNVQADSFNKDRIHHAGNQYQAEVIIYDRVLTELERLQVETYLTNKWFTAPSGYGTWASTFLPDDVSNPSADFDGDGLANSIEYVLGTSPIAPGAGNAESPAPAIDGADFVVTFNRAVASKTPDTTVVIETGTDLESGDVWSGVYTVGDTSSSGPGYSITVGPASGGFEPITLRIERGTDVRKFARLKVAVTGP